MAAAVSLLEGMMEVLSSAVKLETSSPQLAELYQYLCLTAPFGTPNETNPSNLKFQIQFRKGVAMPKEKVECMCSSILLWIYCCGTQ